MRCQIAALSSARQCARMDGRRFLLGGAESSRAGRSPRQSSGPGELRAGYYDRGRQRHRVPENERRMTLPCSGQWAREKKKLMMSSGQLSQTSKHSQFRTSCASGLVPKVMSHVPPPVSHSPARANLRERDRGKSTRERCSSSQAHLSCLPTESSTLSITEDGQAYLQSESEGGDWPLRARARDRAALFSRLIDLKSNAHRHNIRFPLRGSAGAH